MYLGRIVAAGMPAKGNPVAAYRVSSRSFPNRTANLVGETISIIPRKGFESDLSKNPYIAYNCVRLSGKTAVATNGSHTDPIIEKIMAGMNLRDAFTLSLLAMDYEHDTLDTPRIAAAVNAETNQGALGIVRKDAVLVQVFDLVPGKLFYLSTYGKNAPSMDQFDGEFDAMCGDCACNYVIGQGVFADFENPVCSAAAVWTGEGYHLAVKDA